MFTFAIETAALVDGLAAQCYSRGRGASLAVGALVGPVRPGLDVLSVPR